SASGEDQLVRALHVLPVRRNEQVQGAVELDVEHGSVRPDKLDIEVAALSELVEANDLTARHGQAASAQEGAEVGFAERVGSACDVHEHAPHEPTVPDQPGTPELVREAIGGREPLLHRSCK